MDIKTIITPLRELILDYPTEEEFAEDKVGNKKRGEYFVKRNIGTLGKYALNGKKILPRTRVKDINPITGQVRDLSLYEIDTIIYFTCLLCDFNSPLQIYMYQSDADYGRKIIREAIKTAGIGDDIAQYVTNPSVMSLTPLYDDLYLPEEDRKVSKKYFNEVAERYGSVTEMDLTRIAVARREHPLFIKFQENILAYQEHFAFEASYRRMTVMGNLCKVLTQEKIDDIVEKGKAVLDIIQYLQKADDEAMERYQKLFATRKLRLSIEEAISPKVNTIASEPQEAVANKPVASVARSLAVTDDPFEL